MDEAHPSGLLLRNSLQQRKDHIYFWWTEPTLLNTCKEITAIKVA